MLIVGCASFSPGLETTGISSYFVGFLAREFEEWLFGRFVFGGPPDMWWTPTGFVGMFMAEFTPSFIPGPARFSSLFPTLLSMLITIFDGISHEPGEIARSSPTFASCTVQPVRTAGEVPSPSGRSHPFSYLRTAG